MVRTKVSGHYRKINGKKVYVKPHARHVTGKRHKSSQFQIEVDDHDVEQDKKFKAKHPGKRISKNGNVYYEHRENRSDIDRRKKL